MVDMEFMGDTGLSGQGKREVGMDWIGVRKGWDGLNLFLFGSNGNETISWDGLGWDWLTWSKTEVRQAELELLSWKREQNAELVPAAKDGAEGLSEPEIGWMLEDVLNSRVESGSEKAWEG